MSNFSCYLISAFILLSNSATIFFVFSKSLSFSHLSCSAINPFLPLHQVLHYSLTFILFNIFSTSNSSTSSTFTGFTSSLFCPLTFSLYYTTQLTFTTGWILIKLGSHNLTTLIDITSSIVYRPTYQSTNFFAGCFLNIKSFVLNITLSSTFYISASFLPLSTCLFISSCAFFKAAPTSSYTLLTLSTNSVTFPIFSFLLRSTPILNSLS